MSVILLIIFLGFVQKSFEFEYESIQRNDKWAQFFPNNHKLLTNKQSNTNAINESLPRSLQVTIDGLKLFKPVLFKFFKFNSGKDNLYCLQINKTK